MASASSSQGGPPSSIVTQQSLLFDRSDRRCLLEDYELLHFSTDPVSDTHALVTVRAPGAVYREDGSVMDLTAEGAAQSMPGSGGR